MKTITASAFLCLVLVAAARAQIGGVTVDIELEQEQFLPQEDLRVAVRITNHSGQSLRLGAENDWLTFFVESLDKSVSAQRVSPPVAGEFTLDSSLTATKHVNLAPGMDLKKNGRYRVQANVRIPQWETVISSPTKNFTIAGGTKLQVIRFGVPSAEATAAPPEVRKYILQQAEYVKELRMYLRITDDSETHTFKVMPLVRLISSLSKPEAQLDQFNNLHLLTQTARRSFSYFCINSDGQILLRQTHDYLADSRPKLRMAEDGRVIVRGGIRRETREDLPPSHDDATTTPKENPSEKHAAPLP